MRQKTCSDITKYEFWRWMESLLPAEKKNSWGLEKPSLTISDLVHFLGVQLGEKQTLLLNDDESFFQALEIFDLKPFWWIDCATCVIRTSYLERLWGCVWYDDDMFWAGSSRASAGRNLFKLQKEAHAR